MPRPPLIAECIRIALRRAHKPLKAIALAHRCGAKFNSHFRSVIARMLRSGEIVRMDGYRYIIAEKELRKIT